jgi:chromosome segregation ATPase
VLGDNTSVDVNNGLHWGGTMTKTEQREARSDIRDEIEEIDADMIGFIEELRDVRERIATAKARRVELKTMLSELRKGA